MKNQLVLKKPMKERQKSTKEKLRESEEKLKDFMVAATEGFLVYDSDLNLRDINDSALRIIGMRREAVIGKNILEITPGLEKTGRYDAYLNVLKTGKPFYTDDAVQLPKFGNIHLSIHAFKLMEGLGMIFNDVTERVKAEQKLKEEKEKAQTYLDIAGVILLVLNADLTVQLINKKGCDILEEDESEIIGANWIDTYLPEINRELVKREYHRFINGEIELFEYTEEPIIKKNGEKRIIAWHNRALRNAEGIIIGSLSSGQDITERMEVEQKLKESEEKHRVFMETAKDFMHIIDSNGKIIYVNRDFLGYKKEELINMHIIELIAEETRPIFPPELKNLIENGSITLKDLYCKGKDGTKIIGELSVVAIYGTDRKFKGARGIFKDITERKKAEQNLKESEKAYRSLFENMIGGFAYHKIIVDENNDPIDYQFLEANAAFEALTGLKVEDIIGKTVKGILPGIENDPADWIGKYGKVALTGTPLTFESYAEPLDQWYSVLAYSPKKDYFAVIFINITEQKQVEEALKKSEMEYRQAFNRAEFYKDLFTHDINNILQNILSGIQLSEMEIRKLKNIERLNEYFSIIKNQIKRGAKLVSNIRKLSKIEETEMLIKKVEVCYILGKSIIYVKNAYQNKNITISVDYLGKKLHVYANELLEDVFENILVNAIKYNDNLELEILVKISKEQKENINYLKIEFMDNGTGIHDSRKEKVFQRRYSEEINDRGMGLGLSLVKKIINTYKGKIWVEDRVKKDHKKGSNFVILIPEVV